MYRNTAVSQPDPRRWWILGAVALSLLVLSVDNTILNVALPTIARDLDASSGALQWIVDSYLLVFAGLLLTMGSLGDRLGRRRALLSGLAVFGAASAWGAFAESTSSLIAARATMGIGAALIMPATLSIITNVFPPEERAKAIGIWAGVFGIGIAVGPTGGGLLLEHFDWSAVFLVNVPIVLAGLAMAARLVPESRDPHPSRLDPVGAVLSIVALTALVFGIIDAPEAGWTAASTVAALGGGLATLALFVAWELRSAHPMLDVRVFRNAGFSAASAALTLATFSLFGSIFVLTQYLQGVLGYDALGAGLRMLPVAGGLVLAAPLSSVLAARIGTRRTVTLGMGLVTAGLALILLAGASTGYGPVAVAMVVLAAGMGLAMAPATESIMDALPAARAGVGSAMNDTVRMVGGALGVAVLGSLLSTGYRGGMEDAPEAARESLGAAVQLGDPQIARAAADAFVSGMHTASIVAAAVAAAGAVIAVRFLPGRGAPRHVPAAVVPEAAAA